MFSVDERNISNVSDILQIPGYSLNSTTLPILIAYNLLVVIVGIGGNSAVLYLSLVHKALKLDAISLMFVHHLAVSDIMVSLLLYLPTLVVLCARRWVLGKFLCFGVAFSFFIPLIYEVFTILSITVYRAVLITSNIKNEEKLKKTFRCVLYVQLVLAAWPTPYLILSNCYAYFDPMVLTCWPSQAIEPGTPQTVIAYYGIVVLALPITVTAVLSVMIAVVVKLKTRNVRVALNSARDKGMNKMFLTLSLIVQVFIASYVCLILNFILGSVGSFKEQQGHWFDLLMIYLSSLNVVLNPVVYVLTNKKFRDVVFSSVRSLVSRDSQ